MRPNDWCRIIEKSDFLSIGVEYFDLKAVLIEIDKDWDCTDVGVGGWVWVVCVRLSVVWWWWWWGLVGQSSGRGRVVRTLMPCMRLMALSGRSARSVRIVLNAWIPPAPQSAATKFISETWWNQGLHFEIQNKYTIKILDINHVQLTWFLSASKRQVITGFDLDVAFWVIHDGRRHTTSVNKPIKSWKTKYWLKKYLWRYW